jgi:hypothetical protein
MKKNRRANTKNAALKKEFTLKRRLDYLETDYVDGVLDDEGNMAIRPLNEDEKKWLNKFYEEEVHTNFLYDRELRNVQEEIKMLEGKKDPTDEDLERHSYLKLIQIDRSDEVLLNPTEEDRKAVYSKNNARNRCIYNRAKSEGRLCEYKPEVYDEEDNDNEHVHYVRRTDCE